jgi:hypothetical protein
MKIIMLNGFSCSGKDYIGNIICNKYNYKRYAFADSLKIIISEQYNIPLQLLHSQEGKALICDNDICKRTYRQILIDEALIKRNENLDVFVEHCSNNIIKHINDDNIGNNIVITDWRYENEYEFIRKFFPESDIIKVHITRAGQYQSPINDISEYDLINKQITFDYKITNNMDDSIYSEIQKIIFNF